MLSFHLPLPITIVHYTSTTFLLSILYNLFTAIFLGLSELSLKAHGNSDSRAIMNALKVASKFIELNFIEELRKTMEVE